MLQNPIKEYVENSHCMKKTDKCLNAQPEKMNILWNNEWFVAIIADPQDDNTFVCTALIFMNYSWNMETTLSTQGNRVETSFIYITYRGVGTTNSTHN